MLTFYVVANGDLFREGFNALVTFLGEDAFQSFTRIVTAFSIYGVILAIIKHRDFTEMFRWFVMMVFVTAVMVAPKTDLAIYDSSTPGAVLEVDNVPVSLAWIGSTLTSLSFGVTTAMETAFHLPSDLSYSTTGMLFGAKMFQASHDFRILNPELNSEMNDYIQNCIIGDIRINKKYTMQELKVSEALWDTTGQNPSQVRRIAAPTGGTMTCLEAKTQLASDLKEEINNNAIVLYGKKLFGSNTKSYAALFEQYLAPSYNYFINSSQTATDIFMQAMLVNAMKAGIQNYAAMSDNTASLQDYAITKSEIQARMTWATLGIEASYFLPIIQTTLLLLLVCLFPFVVVLSLMPSGFSQWGNYLRSFAYLGLWPPLFAIINMAMNYYLQAKTSVFTGVSMNNFDELAQLHYDSSVIAGYLSLCVPFLAMGLVTNRVLHAIANPVTGILSGLQSGVGAAAQETTSGNLSAGNASYRNFSGNNLNMNKHDTDWTDFHGTVTEQMASGVMKTTTENGQTVYNVSQGLSNIAQSVNLSEQLSQTLSQSAEKAHQSAISESQNVQSSLTHAASHFVQLGDALSSENRHGDHVSSTLTSSENEALSYINAKTDELSKQEHISKEEAFQRLGQWSVGGSAHLDSSRTIWGKAGELLMGAKADASLGYNAQRTSTGRDSYTHGENHGMTEREAQDLSHAFSVLSSHQQTQSHDSGHSTSASFIDNFASDLREAQTSAHNRDVSISNSERLSEMATTAKTNSASVNSNLNQAFVDYVRSSEGDARADSLFSNPGSLSSQQQLTHLASRFVHQVSQDMMSGETTAFENSVQPEQHYTNAVNNLNSAQGTSSLLEANQVANQSLSAHRSSLEGSAIPDAILHHDVFQQKNTIQQRIDGEGKNLNQSYQHNSATMEKTLDEGMKAATTHSTPFFDSAKEFREAQDKINFNDKGGSA